MRLKRKSYLLVDTATFNAKIKTSLPSYVIKKRKRKVTKKKYKHRNRN